MENLDERRKNTEECRVVVMQDKEVPKTVDVSGMVINAVTPYRNNEIPGSRDAIDAIEAVTIGKDGTFAVDVHGPKKVEKTETTQEMEAREAAEKKRIAEMPSPREDTDDAR